MLLLDVEFVRALSLSGILRKLEVGGFVITTILIS
jgi:hypothetical protein